MLTNNILLIDDDPEDFDIFCGALATLDKSIDCIGATSCSDGFSKLEASSGIPRYIFLDLNMPFVNGFECLYQIKNDDSLAQIPIVIFSTSNDPRDRETTQKMGASLFFSKPNEFGELKSKLARILHLQDLSINSQLKQKYKIS